MRISSVVAASLNGVIGKDNRLPWELPDDLANFQRLTKGHPMIMGRMTFESIGRVLPERKNIIITRDLDYKVDGAVVVHNIEDAVEEAKKDENEEVFVIGGESIFKMAEPYVTRIYLTLVQAVVEGDRFFGYDKKEWKEVSKVSHKADDANEYDYDFLILDRI